MKKLFYICAALTMFFYAGSAMAADVTGDWTATAQTPDGNSFQLSYTFKVDGATLTGSVQGPQGDPIAISNGKVDGNKVTFDIAFNGMTIHNDCTVNGDEIALTSKSDSGDFPGMQMTLKRAGAAATPATPAAPAPPAAPQK